MIEEDEDMEETKAGIKTRKIPSSAATTINPADVFDNDSIIF